MDERLGGILISALRAADKRGVARPRIGDLLADDRDLLAEATLEFLASRPHTPSPYPDWLVVRSFDAGVLRWWNDHLGGPFPSRTTQRLQTLRGDVYDFLDDLGRIVKEPGQYSPVHVAPLGESVDDAFEQLHKRTIQVSPSGAGFGDAETNRLVEVAAMGAAIAHYHDWEPYDVSSSRCGWDITFRRGGNELHVEVKGVSGQRAKVLLTRNEVAVARADQQWSLLVVTRALVSPQVHEVDRDTTLAAVEPYVYIADLE